MSAKPTNISIINSLRGLAALTVCFYHFVVTTTGFVKSDLIREIFEYGSKGVQLFFIISGIVIPLSMIKSNYDYPLFGKFILKRFIRIEPPYLAAVVLGLIYLYVRNFIPSAAGVDLMPSWRDIALHLGYLIPFVEGAQWINSVFWTLSIEFQYYLFLALLLPLALRKEKIFLYIFNLILIIIPVLTYRGNLFPNWAAYFALGIFYTFFITKKLTWIEYLVFTALCIAPILWHQGPVDLGIGLVSLWLIHNFSSFTSKIGEFFGKISYSLYLLHSIVGSAFVNFMSHRYSSPLAVVIIVLIGVLISVASAYIFWRFIEKPSQRASKKIKLR